MNVAFIDLKSKYQFIYLINDLILITLFESL